MKYSINIINIGIATVTDNFNHKNDLNKQLIDNIDNMLLRIVISLSFDNNIIIICNNINNNTIRYNIDSIIAIISILFITF